jgi:hypothetical protein
VNFKSNNLQNDKLQFDDLQAGCPFVIDQLHAAVEGQLDKSTASFVESHVDQCPSCRLEKDRLQRERLELLESFVVAPRLPDRFAQKVVTAIRDAKANQQHRARLLRRRFVVGLAAGLILGAAIFGVVLQTVFSGGFSGGSSSEDLASVASSTPSDESAATPSTEQPSREVVLPVPAANLPEAIVVERAVPLHRTPVMVAVAVNSAQTEMLREVIQVPVIFDGEDAPGQLTLRAAAGAPPCDVDVNLDGVVDELDHVYMILARMSSSPAAAEIAAQLDCYDC